MSRLAVALALSLSVAIKIDRVDFIINHAFPLFLPFSCPCIDLLLGLEVNFNERVELLHDTPRENIR